jgi:tRNA pseudouridine55 synthase
VKKERVPFRNVTGVLLLDKPSMITSNKALQTIKHLFQASKAGHTGSLDPLAHGMLPICFGEATKFSHFLLESNKEYHVIGKLGEKTTTGDAEGSVIETREVKKFPEEELKILLNRFKGEISQVPSMYSALKHQGQPLYELARKGLTVERKSRQVTIFDLRLVEYAADQLTLVVKCSKGTYIRTLIEDIGEAMGCGAHVAYLRRLTVSSFCPEQMITISKLEEIKQTAGLEGLDRYLLPSDAMLPSIPRIQLTKTITYYLRRGQAVLIPHAPTEGWVKLFDETNCFLGLGEVLSDGKIAPRRLINEVV